MSGFRVGSGFDAHRLVPGRPLMLGGVEVPFARGLEGHSDGDCLLHAICDALLGAAASGDMGRHFPSGDPSWKGAASRLFLEETRRVVAAAGFVVENVDATVIAEAPRARAAPGRDARDGGRVLGHRRRRSSPSRPRAPTASVPSAEERESRATASSCSADRLRDD